MISAEEAKFYIDNCPHDGMDGDGDGIPCNNNSEIRMSME